MMNFGASLCLFSVFVLFGCTSSTNSSSANSSAAAYAYLVCDNGIGDAGARLLDQTYSKLFSNDSMDYQITSSAQNGIVECEYTFPTDYTSEDPENTYFHHAVQVVGLTYSSFSSANMNPGSATITDPLHNISDVITKQISTDVLQKENQKAAQEAQQLIQNMLQYNRDHPCELWQFDNGDRTCIQRQGDGQ